jgi:hypothetical protein
MNDSIPTLDLHGIKHADVESIVEEFVCMNTGTIRIITGYSSKMKEHVNNVLLRYDMKSRPDRLTNDGALISW